MDEKLQELSDAYKSAQLAANEARLELLNEAIAVFPLRVGDVVELRDHNVPYEAIVSKIEARAEIAYWSGSDVSLRMKVWTRKKTATGWHKTQNEQYSVSDKNFKCQLKIVRREELPS